MAFSEDTAGTLWLLFAVCSNKATAPAMIAVRSRKILITRMSIFVPLLRARLLPGFGLRWMDCCFDYMYLRSFCNKGKYDSRQVFLYDS